MDGRSEYLLNFTLHETNEEEEEWISGKVEKVEKVEKWRRRRRRRKEGRNGKPILLALID